MKNTVNYDRWRKLIVKIQLIMVSLIFLVEVVNNALLYVNRSQGYGPDTIVAKLLRYLILTTIINFGTFFLSLWIVSKNLTNYALQKYVLILSTVIIVGDVAFSHYQFADTLCLFAVPICLTILYEDKTMCLITSLVSAIPLTLACVARGMDPGYNRDIAPETAIAFASAVLFYIISRLCISNIIETRKKLDEALISEEEKKYATILKRKTMSWRNCPPK